jgi:hypothetical protein
LGAIRLRAADLNLCWWARSKRTVIASLATHDRNVPSSATSPFSEQDCSNLAGQHPGLRSRSCEEVSSATPATKQWVLLDEAIFPAREDRLKPTPDNNPLKIKGGLEKRR